MTHLLAIAVGGAVGAMARYGVCVGCNKWLPANFAWGILLANTLGCLVIGMLMHLAFRPGPHYMPESLHAGLTVGLLGAFTTFSTFGYDTVDYWQRGAWQLAAANVVASLILGLTAVVVGQYLGRIFFPAILP